MAGILIVDQIQNSSNTGQLTFDNSGNFTTGNLICNGTITGGTGLLNIGSGQIYKDTSGNVGIGTSSPGYKLEVAYGSTSDALVITGSVDNTAPYLSFKGSNGGSSYIRGRIRGAAPDSTNGGLVFETGVSGSTSERMRLDSSGNLGLGVTPPTGQNANWRSAFVYNASIQGRSSDGSCVLSANIDTQNKYITSSYGCALTLVSGQYQFFTAPSGTAGATASLTQAMTLDSNGALFLGTTSWTNSTAGIKFQGGSNADKCQFASVVNGDWNVELYGTGGNRVRLFTSAGGGTQVGSITCNTTNAAFNTSSDERLKTNITPAGSAIQSILDFPVDQFDWISTGEHQDFGAVAQKVQPIIPEMVSVPADEDEMWGIDWSKAVPRLIKTIQELSAQNKALEERLAKLENK